MPAHQCRLIDRRCLRIFPFFVDDKARFVGPWIRRADPGAKGGGDASGPFRILSLANSADAEGKRRPRRRGACLFGRKSVHKSSCFRAARVTWKYDNRCGKTMEDRFRISAGKIPNREEGGYPRTPIFSREQRFLPFLLARSLRK